ncbi:shikimate dehydrogenase family protein [Microbacterium telephonicum]|uniref:Shikimate dehydrogenase n=1 Tax=Microbacterium telephonicum TaxID=1714841 RepID=A0A498C0P3_9MICO|nr:shikimate dehydrogenase [Microbacterium telephonicum]RLK49182.1 shikimate dehydrogenase [Microbacterium telephonicum]
MAADRSRLEVWGDPIAHSLSPALHSAAYAQLQLPWEYGRRRVDDIGFAGELSGLDDSFRGLSCTMPLKGVAHAASVWRDARAEATGAVNTLLLTSDGPRGWNTDVGGIVRALADAGITSVDRARIVGAGATATSALVAVAELGARDVEVLARRPDAVAPLTALGERLGLVVTAAPLSDADRHPVTVTFATLPGSAAVDTDIADTLAASGGLLFDVVYGHGQTDLTRAWGRVGARTLDGTGMLLQQAVLQIRVFATGDVDTPLPAEHDVIDVMRRALVGG